MVVYSIDNLGLMEGRQTVHAPNEVIRIARKVTAYSPSYRRLCTVITLDVKNAFNSASRQLTVDELQRRGMDKQLVCIILWYLSKRRIVLEAQNMVKTLPITSSVPYESILGD